MAYYSSTEHARAWYALPSTDPPLHSSPRSSRGLRALHCQWKSCLLHLHTYRTSILHVQIDHDLRFYTTPRLRPSLPLLEAHVPRHLRHLVLPYPPAALTFVLAKSRQEREIRRKKQGINYWRFKTLAVYHSIHSRTLRLWHTGSICLQALPTCIISNIDSNHPTAPCRPLLSANQTWRKLNSANIFRPPCCRPRNISVTYCRATAPTCEASRVLDFYVSRHNCANHHHPPKCLKSMPARRLETPPLPHSRLSQATAMLPPNVNPGCPWDLELRPSACSLVSAI